MKKDIIIMFWNKKHKEEQSFGRNIPPINSVSAEEDAGHSAPKKAKKPVTKKKKIILLFWGAAASGGRHKIGLFPWVLLIPKNAQRRKKSGY